MTWPIWLIDEYFIVRNYSKINLNLVDTRSNHHLLCVMGIVTFVTENISKMLDQRKKNNVISFEEKKNNSWHDLLCLNKVSYWPMIKLPKIFTISQKNKTEESKTWTKFFYFSFIQFHAFPKKKKKNRKQCCKIFLEKGFWCLFVKYAERALIVFYPIFIYHCLAT